MKIVTGTKRIVGGCLVLGAALVGSTGLADVVCQSDDSLQVVKGFELADSPDDTFWSKKAAVILNIGSGNVLLTGKVTTTPTRVGSHVSYVMVDAAGVELNLSYSLSILDGSFLNCTRAGCDDLVLDVGFQGTLLHGGETYELQCQKVGI